MKIILNAQIEMTVHEFVLDLLGQYYNVSERSGSIIIEKVVDKDSTIPDITIQPINVNTISVD